MQRAKKGYEQMVCSARWFQTAGRRGGDVAVLAGLLLLPLCVGAAGSGDLDTGFGGDGTVTTSFGSGRVDTATALTPQPDGKIVAAGRSDGSGGLDLALARYHAITCNGVVATRTGTTGHDTLVGTAGRDVIVGFDGDDTI